MSSGGNQVPKITQAEHIGPDDTGDNIEAKRVANYAWDGSSWARTSPNIQVSNSDVSGSNPVPITGTVTAVGAELDVEEPINTTAYNLNSAAYSQTTAISTDYLLSHIEMNFTTTASRDITVTTTDGTKLRELLANTSRDVVLDFDDKGFNSNENITVSVTQTASACVMDLKVVIKQGSIALGGNPVLDEASFGRVSSSNSTSSPLGSNATFTGSGELNSLPDVLVTVFTDTDCTLYAEFSSDGTNWDSSRPLEVNPSTYELHRFIKGTRYFRVRLVNGSSAQSFLRLSTSYGLFGVPNSPLNSIIQQDADAITVRSISDETAIVGGLFAGYSIINKFGINTDVDSGTTPEDVWGGGGLYNGFPSSAGTVEVLSTSANDTAAGTGARTIQVIGLDSNYNVANETITLNGTSASTASSTSFIRIHTAQILTAGSGGVNAGVITVRQVSSPTVIFLSMQAGRNQTNNSAYTVPAGYTAYMRRLHGSVRDGASATASGYVWTRAFNGVFRARRPFSMGSGDRLNDTIYGGLTFTERSDIIIRIESVSSNDQIVTAGYDLILVEN